ncbi:MAG TPA: GTP cyclohydrolase II [Rhodopila sp.]|uniref:GTP cyclohydrolase II n=1 Tax=Rhodopila sp. TaxID=2480087 RepID=UPI002C1E3C75|nr:GTP cyclohydrolase II [Rhodopila sp.]HVY15769.1 GTP cyclohydrolase II [Rhodopila sp.]
MADQVDILGKARRSLRRVHRAASDLRRGVPVVLAGERPLAILAAETADLSGFAEFTMLGQGATTLILAPARAAAVAPGPVDMRAAATGLVLPAGLDTLAVYQALADPTVEQPQLPEEPALVPAPADAAAALGLAKAGQLLPAVLARTLPAEYRALLAAHAMIEVAPEEVLGFVDHEIAVLQQLTAATVPLADSPETRVVAFRSHASATEHLAIVVGRPETAEAPLVRIHSACYTGDVLGSMRCDCGEQLRGAIHRMSEDGSGVLLYMAQEGRGIGLANKLRAYDLQDRGLDTMDANRALGWGADERRFEAGAVMLRSLGIKRVRLMTNNPDKLAAMQAHGIEVAEREAHLFAANGINDEYLATKASRFGHMLD